jgi:hypothetical protein
MGSGTAGPISEPGAQFQWSDPAVAPCTAETARRALRAGDSLRAAAILEDTRSRFGDSRPLLRSLVTAYQQAGRTVEAKRVAGELERIEARLLY